MTRLSAGPVAGGGGGPSWGGTGLGWVCVWVTWSLELSGGEVLGDDPQADTGRWERVEVELGGPWEWDLCRPPKLSPSRLEGTGGCVHIQLPLHVSEGNREALCGGWQRTQGPVL